VKLLAVRVLSSSLEYAELTRTPHAFHSKTERQEITAIPFFNFLKCDDKLG
jgi:hypothetical protein